MDDVIDKKIFLSVVHNLSYVSLTLEFVVTLTFYYATETFYEFSDNEFSNLSTVHWVFKLRDRMWVFTFCQVWF